MNFELNQTDGHIGKLPEDWTVMPLGHLSKSITDGTHFTPIYTKAGIPFYSVENVSGNEFEDTKFISESDHIKLIKRCQPERGDILMTRIGSLGRTKLISWECNASIYVSLALIKPNLTVLTDYLYAYSQSNFFRKSVINRSLVNAIPQKINMQDIAAIPIPFPPQKVEQEAIAEALKDADEAIEALDALIAKKRDVRQATMQQYSQAERVGSDARMVALGSVVVINKGELITSSTSGVGPYPVIAGGKSPAYFSSKFNRDGLTITISASGANAGYVALRKGKIWASDCSTISEDSSIDMNYLAAQLEVRQEKIYRAQFGGAQPHVRPNDLAPLEICYVPLVQQQEIGRALRAMDEEIEALTEQVSKLRMVKEGMMQDLLTGKVRLV